MKANGCEETEDCFIHCEDYDAKTFSFKVYVCDMIVTIGGERKIIRQFNAYFFEPKMSDFYQLSLAAGPFTMPTMQLKPKVIDLEEDQVTSTLHELMRELMDGTRYKI